jgi:hypothetical protein
MPVSSDMPFASVLAFSPASPAASACRHPRYEETAEDARASHQRSANASGTGDTTFSIISTGGSRHTGAEGREPHCKATKTVTGLQKRISPRPLTLAEIRRPLDALLPHPRADLDRVSHTLNWSTWRRRRQATTRHCHYKRRTSGNKPLLEYESGGGCGGAGPDCDRSRTRKPTAS